jgi:hypothetical protein
MMDFAINPEMVSTPKHAIAGLVVGIEEACDWFGGRRLTEQHWLLNLKRVLGGGTLEPAF